MIIVKLKGGLGNQLFQYALGRVLALKNNDKLKLDGTGYDHDRLRHYALDPFLIKAEIATPAEIKPLKYPYGFLSMAWRKFSFKILRRFHIGWEPSILNQTGNLYLDGFWQSYKYFDQATDTLRQDFSLKEPLEMLQPALIAEVTKAGTVSLHIRRTDYVSSKKHAQTFGVLSLEYYARAVAKIAELVPQPTFYIFTDDPTWVKQHLSLPYPLHFVADYNLPDYQELILMSKCRHQIIANSSFSWWGAWLNPRIDKIVIAPTWWFKTGIPKINDIIPPSWIKI